MRILRRKVHIFRQDRNGHSESDHQLRASCVFDETVELQVESHKCTAQIGLDLCVLAKDDAEREMPRLAKRFLRILRSKCGTDFQPLTVNQGELFGR